MAGSDVVTKNRFMKKPHERAFTKNSSHRDSSDMTVSVVNETPVLSNDQRMASAATAALYCMSAEADKSPASFSHARCNLIRVDKNANARLRHKLAGRVDFPGLPGPAKTVSTGGFYPLRRADIDAPTSHERYQPGSSRIERLHSAIEKNGRWNARLDVLGHGFANSLFGKVCQSGGVQTESRCFCAGFWRAE